MTNKLPFKITGMHCVTCATQVEKAIASVKGVRRVTVNFISEKAIIEIEHASSDIVKNIVKVVEKQGYKAQPSENNSSAHESHTHESSNIMDLGIAMLFSLPLIFHMLGFHISPSIQLACGSIVQFWSGRRFYKASWNSLKHFKSDMDALVTIGTSAAYGYSLAAVILHSSELYFEAAALVITLVLLGRFLEDRAKHSANTAVRSLMNLAPPTALVEREGVYVEVLSQEIKKGDNILVKAWQRIPVDGIVLQGASEVNESMITGESVPVFKEKGAKVIGGTTNTSGILYLEATAVGQHSTLARMIHLVEEAQSSRPPIQKLVDQVSSIFVPLVLLISLITLGGWLVAGASLTFALLTAVSVLVIACPCALGLATPTAIVVAMGEAARKGILIKNLESLELLRKIDQVVFDKTGTLTKGEFSLTSIDSLSDTPQEQLVLLAASLQKGSEHPLSKAFLKATKGQTLLEVKDFASFPGKGIQGKIKDTLYLLGSEKLMREHGISPLTHPKSDHTTVYIAEDRLLLGAFRLADTPRKRAFDTIRSLKKMGLKTIMLTGDNKETAQAIGKKVGIDEVMAHLQPKDKIRYIKAQQHHRHHVAMVGDGVNDAPALAAATVGFAMGSGTDVAIDAAPITLMRPSLELIPQAFTLSKRTFIIILENFFWAFIFNIVGIGFAAFGKLNPEIAGAAMAASSLLVVTNSLRLKMGSTFF